MREQERERDSNNVMFGKKKRFKQEKTYQPTEEKKKRKHRNNIAKYKKIDLKRQNINRAAVGT